MKTATRTAALLFGAFFVLNAAAVAVAADPMDWQAPFERPAFRELVKGEEFRTLLEAAVAEDEFLKLQKSNAPVLGAEIVHVVEGSLGARHGFEVGGTIVAVDGHPLWLGWMRTDIARTIDVVEASGKRRSIDMPAGMMGIHGIPRWRPELVYVRGKQRSDKWNRFVLAGIKLRGTAPDVAETAWHHAIAAGYRHDFLSDQCGAEIALLQGRAAALDFGAMARRADPDKGELVNPRLLFRVAMANYKLRDALSIMEQHPWAFMGSEEQPDPIRRLIAIHEKRPLAAGPDLAPSERYDKLKKTDLVPSLIGLKGNAEGMDIAKWLREKPTRMVAPANEYSRLRLAPKEDVRDIELLVRYRFKATDDKPMQYLKVMQAGILDPREESELPNQTPRYMSPTLSTFTDVNGQCQWVAANWVFVHYWHDPRVRSDGKTEHEIRILRHNGRGEIFVNGARVLYTPLRDDIERACVLLQVVGTSAEITQLRVVALSE